MKSRVRVNRARTLKTRSSIKTCEERLACKGDKPISTFFCDECNSYQCHLCEALLHEDDRLSSHSRNPVVGAPEEVLCDSGCIELNFADVYCTICDAKFCYSCDYRTHSKEKKRTHIRRKFVAESEEFLSCEDIAFETETLEDCESMMSESQLNDSSYESANGQNVPTDHKTDDNGDLTSFVLLNEREQIQLTSQEFMKNLKCENGRLLKVVSIFGNTGDGKSYTLNHTFFNGKEIFSTSNLQASCTIGVWAARSPDLDAILIDTEGFLGQSTNPNRRARMLLKVLAISDIVVYRTRAERLHNDMFKFLGDSSVAYARHFSKELEEMSSRCNINEPISSLGPAVIIFHETCHTLPLSNDAKVQLGKHFHELGLKLDSFSGLEYIGLRTSLPPTDFKPLRQAVIKHLENSSVRTARPADVIYNVLKVLNDRFSGTVESAVPSTFPDQYFTCPVRCRSCNTRCTKSMNHVKDGELHFSSADCVYQYQFENKIFLCKVCFERGEKIVVPPKRTEANDSSILGFAKYAWAGYLLECSKCGVIYRSRQYWYGNKDPWETCVRTEICHIWSDENEPQENQYKAQYILDNITSVSEVVQQYSSRPTRMLSSWVADQIAPSYWVPNSKVTNCGICGKEFEVETKHHCRMCGGVFCEKCSTKTMPVPGWGTSPVRVCDKCFENGTSENEVAIHPPETTARKIGEVVHSTLNTFASAVNYPIDLIKATARPEYWIPDHVITQCCACEKAFSPQLTLHHCRACGKGVCDPCSTNRCPVPSRRWFTPVRVCNLCVKEEKL